MHVAVDLYWFGQIIVLVSVGILGLLYLVRNTASRYFVVDSNFDSSAADYSSLDHRKREQMAAAGSGAVEISDSCAVCGLVTKKQCARCKMVKYCSEACQKSHWNSEHKMKCEELLSLYKSNQTKTSALRKRGVSLVPVSASPKIIKQSNKILFPYGEFIELFNWDNPGYPPCGLLNCGNSCFANVVLQCLSYTRPLVAYLLEKGHRIECQRDDWCFLCEFQTHVERTSRSLVPFSPLNILSRLPNIGGNLGYGKQEDAHEFMRFAIDTMQSVCLDEFGGEKAVHPKYQETTLIQHIFGGRLQSQVICTECNNVSNQFENMMDLTVEIHGDSGSLEECLDQFTAKEWLHGDNMYKCDGCNAYVMAWKRLTVRRAPNILTIALKRFQSGRFGKLNKRVTFPEMLDLSPYMNELEDGNDVYKLYAVIVHVDMLNASFFGHYICYVKDFSGNWYRIDDCKVATVDLDEVLSQGAYMLLYSRISARRSCLLPESIKEQGKENVKILVDPSHERLADCLSGSECVNSLGDSGQSSYDNCSAEGYHGEEFLSVSVADTRGSIKPVSSGPTSPATENAELHDSKGLAIVPLRVASPVEQSNLPCPSKDSVLNKHSRLPDVQNHALFSSISDVETVDGVGVSAADDGLSRHLTEKSTLSKNCDFEEGITSDISTSSVSAEAPNELNSSKNTSVAESAMLENGITSPNDMQDVAKKLDLQSSSPKFKPIFVPGFLGKRPRKNVVEPDNIMLVEPGELIPKTQLNDQTNEAAKSHLSCENGSLLRHGFLKDGFLKDERSASVVRGNGKVSIALDACENIKNGHASDKIVSCEETKSDIPNGKVQAGEEILISDAGNGKYL